MSVREDFIRAIYWLTVVCDLFAPMAISPDFLVFLSFYTYLCIFDELSLRGAFVECANFQSKNFVTNWFSVYNLDAKAPILYPLSKIIAYDATR